MHFLACGSGQKGNPPFKVIADFTFRIAIVIKLDISVDIHRQFLPVYHQDDGLHGECGGCGGGKCGVAVGGGNTYDGKCGLCVYGSRAEYIAADAVAILARAECLCCRWRNSVCAAVLADSTLNLGECCGAFGIASIQFQGRRVKHRAACLCQRETDALQRIGV